jgi:DNA (cytosine-5)-methyltransferase 1
MVMNAKDYGVPQNRERIFIVSILGDQSFKFPKPFPLDKRLKDVLEDKVAEKYYLSDQAVEGFLKHNENHEKKGTGFI